MLFFEKTSSHNSDMKKSSLFINYFGVPGGAERRFSRVFNNITQHDASLLLVINAQGSEALRTANIDTISPDTREINSSPKNRDGIAVKILTLIKLWKIILSERIKHVHYPVDASIFTYAHSFLSKITGVTYSLSIVDSNRSSKKYFSRIKLHIWSRSIAKASRLDILSNGILKNLQGIFPHIPPYEISPCSFTDYSQSKNSENKYFDLVLMSRLCEGKGFNLFFEALTKIKESNQSDIIRKIGIFGKGPLQDHLEHLIQNYPEFDIDLDHTQDPFDIFSKTKIFLSLQDNENYPSQSILEAMSCGAIVIATDVGETHRLVPDGIGYRVPPEPAALASQISLALQKYNRDEINTDISTNFVKQNHTIDIFSKYFLNFLRSASLPVVKRQKNDL